MKILEQFFFCKCEHSQSMLKLSNVSHTASVQGELPGTCTGSGFGVLGLGCQRLERRLCVCGFCLKCSKQAVVRNDSHMIPGWNKTSNFVFTYLDKVQVCRWWVCGTVLFLALSTAYRTWSLLTMELCCVTVKAEWCVENLLINSWVFVDVSKVF